MIVIPIEQIRDDFDKYYSKKKKAIEWVEELAGDISKNGLKKPPIVHKIGDDLYEVVEGVHRVRALKRLGFKEILCEVSDRGPQASPCPRDRY
jgi:ParB-like chromosome segregation protein Spo0J